MYAINEPIDDHVMRPIAQAYVDYVPRLIRLGVSNVFGNIDDLFSGINGLLQGKTDKAGNDFGRVLVNIVGLGLGLIDIAIGPGHSQGQRGFRADLRLLGHPAGAVPVHSVVGADDGARRHRHA